MPVDVNELEDIVLAAADARPSGAGYLSVRADWRSGDVTRTVKLDGTVCSQDEPWDYRLEAGGMRGGVHVRAVPHPDLPQRTTPFAPLAAQGIALCERVLGTPVGRLRAQAEGEPV